MSAGSRFILPIQQAIGADGPRAGSKLQFWETGTNSPMNTYADASLSTPNVNPVIADSLGQYGNVFLIGSPSYRVQLSDADDVVIWVADPVGPSIPLTGAVPVGGLQAYAGATAPAGYLLCFGQAVSRTTYVELFTAIGTAWGVGDNSTTFNVPDFRGRTPFGRDDMGGASANRITSGVSGINGILLGATGGDQRRALHNHTVTDPGHVHSVTDPGHYHQQGLPSGIIPGTPGGQVLAPFNGLGGRGGWGDIVTYTNTTGISIPNHTTGLTVDNSGAGTAQNMPPAGVVNWLIFANA